MTRSRRHLRIRYELASLFELPHMAPILWFAVWILRQGWCSLAFGAEPVLSTLERGHPLDEMWPVPSKWQRCNLVHLKRTGHR
jgi:hypothetical protein